MFNLHFFNNYLCLSVYETCKLISLSLCISDFLGISIYYEEIDNKRVMIVAGNQHKQ